MKRAKVRCGRKKKKTTTTTDNRNNFEGKKVITTTIDNYSGAATLYVIKETHIRVLRIR